MKLLVTDSHLKARRIWEFLGRSDGWAVVGTDGPVVDFVSRGVGVDTRLDFIPNWEDKPPLKSVLSKAKQADSAYLVFDESDDGEFAVGHLRSKLLTHIESVHRCVPSAITKKHILKALQSETDPAMDELNFEVSVARRMVDRLISVKLSKEAAKTLDFKSLKLSRTSALILSKVVEHYHLRRSTPYVWEIDIPGTPFWGQVGTKEEALEALDAWKNVTSSDFSFRYQTVTEDPPRPLSLASLLDLCSDKGFSSNDVISQLRLLYDHGFITTPSMGTSMDPEFADSCARFLSSIGHTPGTPPSGSGSECIRPVDISVSYTDVPRPIQDLYQIIWFHTVASTAEPARVRKIYTEVMSGPTCLRGNTEEVLYSGYRRVLGMRSGPEVDPSSLLDRKLNFYPRKPTVDYPGECATISDMAQIFPSCGSLVYEIERLCASRLIRKRKGRLAPTLAGLLVHGWLFRVAPELLDRGMSEVLEQRLDLVHKGRDTRQSIMSDYYEWLEARRPAFRSATLPKVDGMSVVFDQDRQPYLVDHQGHRRALSVDTQGAPAHFYPEPLPGSCSGCSAESLCTAFGRFGIYIRCSACGKSEGDYL